MENYMIRHAWVMHADCLSNHTFKFVLRIIWFPVRMLWKIKSVIGVFQP